MSDLSIFKFENCELRTLLVNDEPWFVAPDVCGALGLENVSMAVARLDDDEKADISIVDTSSNGVTQARNILTINESGLYSLILTSRKEEAKRFKKWVTSEVLPTIRKTGSYSVKKNQNLVALAESLAISSERGMLTKQDANNILSAAALSLFPGADVIFNSLISESDKKEVSSYEKSWIKFKNKRSVNPPSGHTGISWIKGREKWKAHVRENGKRVYIGLFLTIDEAVAAVNARKAKITS